MKKEPGFPLLDRTKLSLQLIEEEFKETYQACAENNFKEVQDGLGDLLWVTIRAMFEHGLDPHDTIKRIYESNMSKADITQEDAIVTYKKYMEQGIQTYCKEVDGMFITYRTSDNKVLKSHRFKEPEL